MPAAVPADIGGGALAAGDRRWSVIIGKAAKLETGAIIVPEADRVGQPVIEAMMMAMGMMIPSGFRQARREHGGAEQGSGIKPLHLESPKMSLK
jgi:acetyl-CoA carboxylase alpha subunit